MVVCHRKLRTTLSFLHATTSFPYSLAHSMPPNTKFVTLTAHSLSVYSCVCWLSLLEKLECGVCYSLNQASGTRNCEYIDSLDFCSNVAAIAREGQALTVSSSMVDQACHR